MRPFLVASLLLLAVLAGEIIARLALLTIGIEILAAPES